MFFRRDTVPTSFRRDTVPTSFRRDIRFSFLRKNDWVLSDEIAPIAVIKYEEPFVERESFLVVLTFFYFPRRPGRHCPL
jgi:hypothetical protein